MFPDPEVPIIDCLTDSGSSVVKGESAKTGLSTSFSMVDERANTGTDPVTPAELDEKVRLGRAMTENLSKLSGPSLMIDKSLLRNLA
jgi:hypothetical protein